MNNPSGMQEREIGTTPAGGVVTMDPDPVLPRVRWQKLVAYGVAIIALLAGFFGVLLAPVAKLALLGMIFAAYCTAIGAALITYCGGNTIERAITEKASAMLAGKLKPPPQ